MFGPTGPYNSCYGWNKPRGCNNKIPDPSYEDIKTPNNHGTQTLQIQIRGT